MPCQHTHIFTPHRPINLNRAAQYLRVIGIAGIQTVSGDYNIALPYLKAAKVSCLILRLACSQSGTGSIDKSPSVHLNSRRVCNHHFGTSTTHLNISAQQRGISRIDLIHNDTGLTTCKPGVALYPAAQLCLYVSAAVVQNGAMVVNIEMGVLVN